MEQLNDQEWQRREKLKELRALGIDPYPPHRFDVNVNTREILDGYSPEQNNFQTVSIAGRIMSLQPKGKATFIKIQDQYDRIQLYISIDNLCPGADKTMYEKVVLHLLDIGDFIGVKGETFRTKTGETSIRVRELILLAKGLRPLPIVKEKEGETFDAFTDPELRYRQRYVDLVVNPEVKQTFLQRTKLINSMRHFMSTSGYMEVETPILQPMYGGASARPFTTHHHTLDMTLYLRIANELYLKRLIVGGFDGVFEFAKNFRNEGMSRFHNPEFTGMELYVAYKDCYWMMDFAERMVEQVALDLHAKTEVTVGQHTINFARPWKRYSMMEAIQEYTGVDIRGMDEEALRQTCKQLKVETDNSMGKGKLIDAIFGTHVEHRLIQPTFITDYPIEMSPLAKRHRDHEGLVERFEVICNGKEICNAFSELNDPIDQRERLEEQVALAGRGDEEAMGVDDDFLRALEYGMPPTAGIGFGIDRLTMIMTNQTSIQEVLFFPQMRPEN